MTEKNCHFSQNVWKYRLKTLIWRVFIKLCGKWPKCSYDIPVHIIKLSKHIIAPVLTTIFNNCIAEGIYPDALKVPKVIPIHKSGDTSNPSNYRPISILPHFSKIFEKILLKDLQSFLDKNNILCPNQFGFRKGFPTVHALMSLSDIITSKRKGNLYTCAIF